ncbi:uncharacterized protein [Chironomus tepperi]|uniref:uncharacterized protein n=1 Tax=Chironomus tepperi TaxID=113505 RepID=UPI00391EFBC7
MVETTTNLNNEESNLKLSEKQPESQQQDSAPVTTLITEDINNEKQHDIEMENLKTKQTTMDQFVQPLRAEKRRSQLEIFSAPAKKISSASKKKDDNKKQFDFSNARTNLYDDRFFNFSGDNSKAPEQPKQREISSSSKDNNLTSQQKPKPPPIHITSGGGQEIRRLMTQINNQPRSFMINVKKDKLKTKVVSTESWDDYDRFIKLLREKQHHFHTYANQEPQMKFVLYGLPMMEIVDLEKELKTENISPVKIVKMTMKQRRHENDDDQNYLLYFNKVQEGNILENLRKVNCVYGFKVKWAKYNNRRNGPSFCSKCLQFGHGQRGCNKPLICFRCSEQHDSKTCPYISIETNKVPIEKLKCHFCGEKHTAISQECNIRKQIIEKWKAKSTNDNNRNQNRPSGEQQRIPRNPAGQRNAPPTSKAGERSGGSDQFTSQRPARSIPEPVPTTSRKPASETSAPVTIKSQNNHPQQKPSNQGNQNKTRRNRRRGRNGNNNRSKPKTNNNHQQNSTQVVEIMDLDFNSLTLETNKVDPEPSSSGNTKEQISPAQGTIDECMFFINSFIEIITKKPEYLKEEQVQQAIGQKVAKIYMSQHGL